MWSREHLRHLQPGLVGLGPRPSWVKLVNFWLQSLKSASHFLAHSGPISNAAFNFTKVATRHAARVRMRQGSLRKSDTWPYSRYVTGIFTAAITGNFFLGGGGWTVELNRPILVTYRQVTRDLRPAVTRHVSWGHVSRTWPGEQGESRRESGCGERRLQWPLSRLAGEEQAEEEGHSRDFERENFRENADSEPRHTLLSLRN